MARASKVCWCGNLKPCATHAPRPWESSDRSSRTVSGSRQQKRSRHVLYRDGGICHVCGRPGATEADHIVALSEGGVDTVDNMAAIHGGRGSCHERKTLEEAQRARTRNTHASRA